MVNGVPATMWARTAPTKPNGITVMISSGCRYERNTSARIVNMPTAANAKPRTSEVRVSALSEASPLTSIVTSG